LLKNKRVLIRSIFVILRTFSQFEESDYVPRMEINAPPFLNLLFHDLKNQSSSCSKIFRL